MHFSLPKSIEILERTPDILIAMLENVSEEWTSVNEGGETWTVFDVVGHLIQGEQTDWVPRMQLILSANADKQFAPFDRFAQLQVNNGKSLSGLLAEFRILRQQNLDHLKSRNLSPADLDLTGLYR
jgi:hypothetical protein